MRPRIRATKVSSRRVLPECSRLTVPRTVAALRRSREALVRLEGQLDDLLVSLRSPDGHVDRAAGDRLSHAKNDAVAAMASLGGMGELFG
jgi:hypothetical protein